MKRILSVVVVILLAALARPVGILQAADTVATSAGTVKVTVNYKGKGTVDASHKVWVYVFDNPNIGAGSMPIDLTSLDKNGAEASFEVAASQVWIAVAFDEQGSMTGDGPPPPGSPVGILLGPSGPQAVTPGDKGTVTLTFDDTTRMP